MTCCDFKPGDEVVCVGDGLWSHRAAPFWMFWRRRVRGPLRGRTYVVRDIALCSDGVGIRLLGVPDPSRTGWWCASEFRKVQRRDLSAWLQTADGFSEPTRKRAPVQAHHDPHPSAAVLQACVGCSTGGVPAPLPAPPVERFSSSTASTTAADGAPQALPALETCGGDRC